MIIRITGPAGKVMAKIILYSIKWLGRAER